MEIYLALHTLFLLFVFILAFLRTRSILGYLVSSVPPHKILKFFAELQPHLKGRRAFKAIKYLKTLIKAVAEY